MNKEWQKNLKDEFGIHFTKSEFQFLVSFIEDLIKTERERTQNILMEFQGEVEALKETGDGYVNGAKHTILEVKRRTK